MILKCEFYQLLKCLKFLFPLLFKILSKICVLSVFCHVKIGLNCVRHL